jgi:GDP-L-fucose synthase
MFDLDGKRVWVAGHKGMVGQALVRRLRSEPCEILTAGRDEVDLRRQSEVEAWMRAARPQAVFLAAARVGGIHANNSFPAEFIYDNLAIETNIIHAAHETGVEKLLFLGSSCIYPREAAQPIRPEALLTGPLEPTNEWYAIAKIAGIKLCQAYRRQFGCDFISAMPTNLFGPGDNFHPEHGHVPAALLRRFHEARLSGARTVTVWGTGAPLREFLYVDDLADACVFLMRRYSGEQHVNVGTGRDLPISEFAAMVARIVDFTGDIVYDRSRPDGTPRKVLDVSALTALGWTAPTPLERGLRLYYDWFLDNVDALRG